MAKVESKSLFIPHWRIWRFVGIYNDFTTFRYLFIAYSLLVNVGISICYPTHLLLGIFNVELKDAFKTIAVGFGCLECSMKLLVFALKIKKLHEFENLLDALDKRIETPEEIDLFQQVCRSAKRIFNAFIGTCSCLGIFTLFSILLKTNRSLFQPAWYPFDWAASDTACNMANLYQFIGIFYQLQQNFVNDTFSGMSLCLMAGHIKMLALRVSRIGYEQSKSLKQNEEELQLCIKDQLNIYKLLALLEDIISWTMFFQFGLTLFNVCMILAAILFYVKDIFDRLFFVAYLFASQLEVFPCCYYGSSIEISLAQLHHSIYSSNWMDQTPGYKKHMILFIERSMKPATVMSKFEVPIHLDTFFRTLKATYTLFAVIIKVKD